MWSWCDLVGLTQCSVHSGSLSHGVEEKKRVVGTAEVWVVNETKLIIGPGLM